MANQRNLKAFVRYDGSGRVVAGSLILRKQKPKVGNWQQIQGYECCNGATVVVVVVVVGVDSCTNAPTCPINCSICLEIFQSSWDCGSCPIGLDGIAILLLFYNKYIIVLTNFVKII